MQPLDYSYVFDDISNHLEPAQVFNHGTQQHAQVRIAVRDQVFRGQFGQPVPPLLADLTDLALAVYFADRLSRRERHQGRRIHIDLALRHMDHLAQPAIGDLLKLILHWFTGDRWSFSFRPRRSAGRFAELQYALFGPPRSEQPVEVALWSGGLDALAGLWNRLQRHPDRQYVLFGTGSHHATHHAQRVVADSVHHMTNASIALVQVPLAL